MTRRASACAAFVIAAGFVLAAMAPAAAEPTDHQGASAERADKPGKPIALTRPVPARKVARSRARVKSAARSRKVTPVAATSQPRKIVEAKTGTNSAAALPAIVADARAQLPAATPMEVAAVDQLNELDRALKEPAARVEVAAPAPTVAILAVRPAPEPAAPTLDVAEPSAPMPGDQSSLLGKMFIALGGVLTLACAARMLIA